MAADLAKVSCRIVLCSVISCKYGFLRKNRVSQYPINLRVNHHLPSYLMIFDGKCVATPESNTPILELMVANPWDSWHLCIDA